MTRHLSLIISGACAVLLVLAPAAAFFYLFNLESFAKLFINGDGWSIKWSTVSQGQWYGQWIITALYISIGLVGIYYLRRAFANFAKGEYFNLSNSQDLQRFSVLLLLQTLSTPLHFALSSVLLSLNHPAGEKMLSVSFGSSEFRAIGVALILWVMSKLLVEGSKLQAENRQFV